MAATDNISITLTQKTGGIGETFTKTTEITSNYLARISFTLASADLTATIPLDLDRSQLKYIGITSDQALSAAVLRDSGASTIVDMGSLTAGQTKQAGSVDDGGADIDFALPGSGNDITDFRITKSAGNITTITLEVYSSEAVTVTT
tara:strand:+ start:1058 stop:1498 length:441 start_codon:yes stop_codon:yes gene_type:complete